VPNANVTINGNRISGGLPQTFELNPGNYRIVLSRDGYQSAARNVTLNSDTTLDINLQPIAHTLRIRTNVGNAVIFVDGNRRGSGSLSLDLQPGRYDVRVDAPGYRSVSQTVNLNSSSTVTFNLERITHTLQIQSNVNGATVYVDGNRRGSGSLSLDLQPGTYEVRIAAEGYFDFVTTVRLNGNETVRANLEPATATLRLEVPPQYRSDEAGGSQGRGPFQLWVDGQRQNSTTIEVEPGTHTIRFVAGPLRIEESFNFQAGTEYVLSPSLDLQLTQ
jgi:uncharacterized membrane protein